MSSPERAIIESMFTIPNKQGKAVPFELTWAQAELDEGLTGRDLVPKARQLGISSYCLGRYTAQCMTQENWRSVIISAEEDATKRLLSRARFIINNLRVPAGIEMEETTLDLPTEKLSQAEIRFTETGAWFYIGTAGSKVFGRGDTINALHCSEVAWWPHAQDLLTGIMGSVDDTSGEIIMESTGNGVANDFHHRVRSSLDGKSHWKTHFFPFHREPSYRVSMTKEEQRAFLTTLDEELEEPRVHEDYKLDAEQLLWRRRKIYDMAAEAHGYVDLQKFKQEFPMSIDECFQASGNTVFERITYRPTSEWNRKFGDKSGRAWLTGHPRPDYHYVAGVDASGGVGKDNAIIQIGCLETNEQVLCWHSNRTPPDLLTNRVVELGKEYNNAYLVIEANNHGLVVLQGLRAFVNGSPIYPSYLIYKHRAPDSLKREDGIMDMGYQTQQRTKALAVGRAAKELANGFVIHDEHTYMELRAFGEDEKGKLMGLDGYADDRVMALVMMFAGWAKGAIMAQERESFVRQKPAPFSLEDALASIKTTGKRTGNEYPIPTFLRSDMRRQAA